MSKLESLARARFPDLLPVEFKLVSNAIVGELAVYGPNRDRNDPLNNPCNAKDWGSDRSIRGELISWLCADREAKSLVGPGGIQIFGAKITTPVKLTSAPIDFPLAFECCQFCDEVNLQGARTSTLSFFGLMCDRFLRMVRSSREHSSCENAARSCCDFQVLESKDSSTAIAAHLTCYTPAHN